MLAKAGLDQEDLLCGLHEPFSSASKTPGWGVLHNNCSGKHALMLATCKRMGWPLPTYQAPDHPLQLSIRDHLSLLSGVDNSDIQWAIDGCGVPAWAIPLHGAATAFARLSDPQSQEGMFEPELSAACEHVTRAMSSHPGMVGGLDRLDTDLMEAAEGRLWAKVGAEGFYAVGLKPAEGRSGLGIAIKVLDGDGSSRARAAVVTELAEKYGALSPEAAASIREKHASPVLRNNRGVAVGSLITRLP